MVWTRCRASFMWALCAEESKLSRTYVSSGSEFESKIGYSRAVVDGDYVFVSGTTGYDYDTMSISSDPIKQAEQCFKNIEKALKEALQARIIAGAATDVLSVEPPVDGNVLLDERIPNLIVTPHVAWIARESRQRLIDQVAGNVKAFLDGKPQNQVI